MSEMTKSQSMERVREGLKAASSCAKEFAAGSKNSTWLEIASVLNSLIATSERLYASRALSVQQTDIIIDKIQRQEHDRNVSNTLAAHGNKSGLII